MGKKAVKKSAAERPWCAVTDMDQYLFGEGTHYEIYKKLGAHPAEVKRSLLCRLGAQCKGRPCDRRVQPLGFGRI